MTTLSDTQLCEARQWIIHTLGYSETEVCGFFPRYVVEKVAAYFPGGLAGFLERFPA